MKQLLVVALVLAAFAGGCSNTEPAGARATALDLSLTELESPFPVKADLFTAYPTCAGALVQPCDPFELFTSDLRYEEKLNGKLLSSASYDYLVKPLPARFTYSTRILVYRSASDAMLAFRIQSRPKGPGATADERPVQTSGSTGLARHAAT